MRSKPMVLDETFSGDPIVIKGKPFQLDVLDDGKGWGRTLRLMDLQETFEGEMPKFKGVLSLDSITDDKGDVVFKHKQLQLDTIFSEQPVA